MDNLEQGHKAIEITAASPLTWHDISLGLWAVIVAGAYGIGKFIKWFSTREIKRFWEDVDVRLDARIKESEERIEAKFLERDKKITDIAVGVEKISAHYHDKTAMETGVLNHILSAVEKLDKKVNEVVDSENKDKQVS